MFPLIFLQDFLKLYYTKKQKQKDQQQQTERTPNDNEPTFGDEDVTNKINVPEKLDDAPADGTLFDEAIEQLKALQSKMLSVLVKHVMTEFKTKSELYKRERYVFFPGKIGCIF